MFCPVKDHDLTKVTAGDELILISRLNTFAVTVDHTARRYNKGLRYNASARVKKVTKTHIHATVDSGTMLFSRETGVNSKGGFSLIPVDYAEALLTSPNKEAIPGTNLFFGGGSI